MGKRHIISLGGELASGKGTASKEIYEFLGVGVIEKDVIFSVCESTSRDYLFKVLIQKYTYEENDVNEMNGGIIR